MMCKNASLGELCNRNIPLRLNNKIYKTTISLVMFYDTKCWAVKKQHIHKMSVGNENVKMGK